MMPSINGVAIPEAWCLTREQVRFLCGSAAVVKLAPPDAPPLRRRPSGLLGAPGEILPGVTMEAAALKAPVSLAFESLLFEEHWVQIQATIALAEDRGATTPEISTRTGLEPRRVREVLQRQALAGKVDSAPGGASRSYLWRLR